MTHISYRAIHIGLVIRCSHTGHIGLISHIGLIGLIDPNTMHQRRIMLPPRNASIFAG